MSQENVEILRRGYEGYNRTGEFELELFDPDGVWDNSNAVFDPAVYRGVDGVREFLSWLREMWKQVRLEPEEFIVVDEDRVIVPTRIVSTGREDVQTIAHNANLFTLRDGKITYVKAFQTKAEALEAAGLRE
jgi:ketosteroid isomerase-like protein